MHSKKCQRGSLATQNDFCWESHIAAWRCQRAAPWAVGKVGFLWDTNEHFIINPGDKMTVQIIPSWSQTSAAASLGSRSQTCTRKSPRHQHPGRPRALKEGREFRRVLGEPAGHTPPTRPLGREHSWRAGSSSHQGAQSYTQPTPDSH